MLYYRYNKKENNTKQPNRSNKMKFKKKTVYGNELFYPVDDNTKYFINNMIRQKTLTIFQIEHLKEIAKVEGFKIEIHN